MPRLSEIVISEPVQLTWLQPHMHVRGKDFQVTAYYATGESEILLKVPHFDFNWQVGYELAKRGQTWDEMSVGFFSVVVDVNSNPLNLFRERNGRIAATEKVE